VRHAHNDVVVDAVIYVVEEDDMDMIEVVVDGEED
jgi:hypothetical protein